MNLYEITTHDFRHGSGSQKVIATNANAALGILAHSKDGSAALERTEGMEIRIFKSQQGALISSSFDNPEPMVMKTEGNFSEPVTPPAAAPQPAPSTEKPLDIPTLLNAFVMGAVGAMLANRGNKPAAKKAAKRKK